MYALVEDVNCSSFWSEETLTKLCSQHWPQRRCHRTRHWREDRACAHRGSHCDESNVRFFLRFFASAYDMSRVGAVMMFGYGRDEAGILVEPAPAHQVDVDDDAQVAAYRNAIW